MLFEGSQPDRARASQSNPARRVWDGVVESRREVWVVVAPEEQSGTDWVHPDDALEISPLRFCQAVDQDGVLVLGETDPEYDEMFSDLLGML